MKVEKKVENISSKKWIIVSAIITGILLAIYLSVSLFFTNRFYWRSYINGVNVTGKTVKQVEDMLVDGSEYTLVLEERDDMKESISGADIKYEFQIGNQIKEAKDNQNYFAWIIAVFKENDIKIDMKATYNKESLKDIFDNLKCVRKDNLVEPENASLKYEAGKFITVKEVKGNKVKSDKLYEEVVKALDKKQDNINLEELQCYENPKFLSDSKEVLEAEKLMNQYVGASITYTRGEEVVDVLDGEKINKWLTVDENFKVTFDDTKVTEYILALDDNYDTVGKTRQFTTTAGYNIQVSGGDYGWIMDNEAEIEELKALIESGTVASREPVYLQKGLTYGADDIGNTYVEIDLTNQYLWFYVNGSLITEGSIVSGNANSQYATPSGVYTLDYKQQNAVLRGPGYACPVSFWMPFNADIGIHDATWRSSFGGQIYMGDGSHGCINAPYNMAKAIFDNISDGTPVVCYH